MELLVYSILLLICEAALAGISIQSTSSSDSQSQEDISNATSSTPEARTLEMTSTLSPERLERIEERLQRSRLHRLFFLRQHVLDSLNWEEPPSIDAETKRRLLSRIAPPVYMTREKTCHYAACDVPYVELPDYINRTLWFDETSSNIRLFFNLQVNTDPNMSVSSAVIKLHLKHRDDCPCAAEDEEPTTSRIHIKIYQYRKPLRSLSRLRRDNRRLVDAKMVTWDAPRWVTFQVSEAVRRIVMRGKRNGGFEVHVSDSQENMIDARSVIDPTICSSINSFDCSETTVVSEEFMLDESDENHETNFSPVLEISSTTVSRIDFTS